MRIDIIRYEPHTLSLRPFKFFYPTASLIFTAAKLFYPVIEKEQSIKLPIYDGDWHEILNLPTSFPGSSLYLEVERGPGNEVVNLLSREMLKFVKSYMKQNKNVNKLESVQHRLELIFKDYLGTVTLKLYH